MPTIIGPQDNGQAKTLADAFSRLGSEAFGPAAQTAQLRGAQTQEALQNAYKLSDANKRLSDLTTHLQSQGIDVTDPHMMGLAVATGMVDHVTAAQLAQTAINNPATSEATARAQLANRQSYGNTGQDAVMRDATTQRGQDSTLQGTKYTADQSRAGAMDRETMQAETARRGQDITAGTTTRGQDITAGTARDVEKLRGGNAMDIEKMKEDAAPVTVIDPTDATQQRLITVSKKDAIQRGLQIMPTKDQVMGGAMQRALQPPAPAAPQQAPAAPQYPAPSFDINGPAPQTPPGFGGPAPQPNGNDLTAGSGTTRPQPPAQAKPDGLQPRTLFPQTAPLAVRKEAGEGGAPLPMIQPGPGGGNGLSYDGGVTVTLGDGRTVPAQGWTPVGPESGADQVRLQQQQGAVKPFLASPDGQGADPTKSAIFDNIRKLGGPKQFAVGELNSILAGTGLSNFIRGGMVGNDVEAAQTNLDLFNRQMLKGLGASGEGPGVKEQGIISKILPSSGFFTNASVEAQKIPILANALLSRNDLLVKQIQSAPTLQATADLRTQLAENEKALQMLTSPNWGNAPFDPRFANENADARAAGQPGMSPDGTPQAAPVTATGPNGQKIKLNPQTNQWEPM